MAILRVKTATRLNGTSSADWIFGSSSDDQLRGLNGNDTIYGYNGHDKIYGGRGQDVLYGHEGNDKLYGDAGNDDLSGGVGNDTIYGGTGHDTLYGGNEEVIDLLYGGAGDDWIGVLAGDVAYGGSGRDTLRFWSDLDAASGNGHVDFSQITGRSAVAIGYKDIKAAQFERVDVSISQATAGCSVTGTKGADSIAAYSSAKGITIDGGAGDDDLQGSQDSIVIGGSGADLFNWRSYLPGTYTIQDFAAEDLLLITQYDQNVVFELTNLLVKGADPVATSAKAQFLYDTDDGKLYLDTDGTGSTAAMHILTLANKFDLTTDHILINY